MGVLKIIGIIILVYFILKIHEVWVLYKHTVDGLFSDENFMQDLKENLKETLNIEIPSDESDSKLKIYGPFTRESAKIRAKNNQFLNDSIIIIIDEEMYNKDEYLLYTFIDEELQPINVNKDITSNDISQINNYIKKYKDSYKEEN